METPKVLYHGSLYKQNELMPGFKRSGELTVWDGVETNQNLYATTSTDEAAQLGIGSATEKVFDSERFCSLDGDVYIYTKSPIEIEKFLELEIYRYTIPYRDSDKWIKNNNPRNNITTEWKTTNTIRGVRVERLDLRSIMKGHKVVLTTAPNDVLPMQLFNQYASETKVYNF